MDWRWLVSSTFRFWVSVAVVIGLAAAIKLNWFRLPRWARWVGVTLVGILGVWSVVWGLSSLVSDLCLAPRREVVTMLVILSGTLVVVGGAYVRVVSEHVKQLRRVIETLKRRIAADHPNDDVLVADDGAVTFRPRPR